MTRTYRALQTMEENGTFQRRLVQLPCGEIGAGQVRIGVEWSSLNYKDGLSASGHRGVTRHFPHTPGIDAAGRVLDCADERFQPGDEVLVTGYDLGMNTAGGWGEEIIVPGDWIVSLPEGLDLRTAMRWGTAGFTAALGVMAITGAGVPGDRGEVLVTGASGGVGVLSCLLLARAGYRPVAATGKSGAEAMLRKAGAVRVISREESLHTDKRPLGDKRWSAVIDNAGGPYLSSALSTTDYDGVVVSIGNVAGVDLSTTVFPFILRGLRLVGVASASTAMPQRRAVWQQLAGPWRMENELEDFVQEATLDTLEPFIRQILAGDLTGRVVVKVAEEGFGG